MGERYRVPKRKVPAELRTAFGAQRVYFFLGESAESHAGVERPSDLLNAGGPFLPVEDDVGRIVLLRRDAPITVTVAAEDELPKENSSTEELADELGTSLRVAVWLEDGRTLEGRVRYLLPHDRSRLQDFLNSDGDYLPVIHDGGARISLVNKRRITRVTSRE